MSFASLMAGDPAPCALLALPRPGRPQAGSFCSSTDGTAPFAQKMKPVTFITVTTLLCQITHFVFLTRVYIYMNYNQLSGNKEVSSKNPLIFIWNSRIQSPNQLRVRDFVFYDGTPVDISWKLGPLSLRSMFLKWLSYFKKCGFMARFFWQVL